MHCTIQVEEFMKTDPLQRCMKLLRGDMQQGGSPLCKCRACQLVPSQWSFECDIWYTTSALQMSVSRNIVLDATVCFTSPHYFRLRGHSWISAA